MVMNYATELLADIEKFIAATGMSAATFGAYAVGNGHLVHRLRQGHSVTTATLMRVQNYLRDGVKHCPKKKNQMTISNPP